jgi:hypothetical protein
MPQINRRETNMKWLNPFSIRSLVVLLMVLLPSLGYTLAVDDPDIVFYFPLNEGEGNIIHDLGPNKFEGQLDGNPTWVTSKSEARFGTALSFREEAKQGAVVPQDKRMWTGEDDFTVCAWFKTGKISGIGTIMIQWDPVATGWYLKIHDGIGVSRFCHRVAAGRFPCATAETERRHNVANDRWNHMCSMRVNRTSVKLFLNGAEVAHENTNHDRPINSMADLVIGRRAGSEYWDGEIDEVFMIKRILSAAEIQRLMGAQLAVELTDKLALIWGHLKVAK